MCDPYTNIFVQMDTVKNFVDEGEWLSVASKRLREEYWYKELASIYSYGLNDTVKTIALAMITRATLSDS